jgi:hypothetical protein
MKTSIRTVDRHLIKGLSIEFSSGFLFVFAAPLFEEEGDFGGLALFLRKGKPRTQNGSNVYRKGIMINRFDPDGVE